MGLQYTTLYRLMHHFDFPDFVKQATVEEIDVPEEGIPPHLYADVNFRLYPCHTKAATVVAAAQFKEDAHKYGEERRQAILDNLRKHARAFDISYHVNRILEEQPREPEIYAWEQDGRKLFPIRNAREVKTAAAYLVDNWRDIDVDIREAVARRILKAAEENGYRLGAHKTALEKMAGYGVVDRAALVRYLEEANLNLSPTDKRLKQAAAAVDDLLLLAYNTDADEQDKLRELVKAASDLAHEVPVLRECPELATMLSETEVKEATDDLLFLKSGSVYRTRDLRIPADRLLDVFGDTFASACINGYVLRHELCKTACELSEEDALCFEELLAASGIYPVVRPSRAKTIPGI